MGDVVTINGATLPSGPEPVDAVVEFARDLLERAQSGDVVCLVASLSHRDGSHSYRYEGRASLATIGNVERMKVALCRDLDALAVGCGAEPA